MTIRTISSFTTNDHDGPKKNKDGRSDKNMNKAYRTRPMGPNQYKKARSLGRTKELPPPRPDTRDSR